MSSEERIRMSPMRKAIARNMKASQETAALLTYGMRVDMTALLEMKKNYPVKASINDFIVAVTSRVLMEFPLLNCSVDGEEIVYHHYVNMGIAVALDDGLIVPVVRDAHTKRVEEIGTEIKALAEKARSGKITFPDISGSTFTITNLGMYGMEMFTPIINLPNVAILGVNTTVDTPVLVDGAIVFKPMMMLNLTADHRVIDGAPAAQFLSRLKEALEHPEEILK